MTVRARHAAATLAFGMAVLPGCATVSYYSQAIGGHLAVMAAAKPIEAHLEDPTQPASLRSRLARVLAIREFASAQLGLPDNASYRVYADLGRPYVVWNVIATDPLSIRPRESCFPVAGCVTYRGFYAEHPAERYAAALAAQGLDVFVYGVPAYSTLGWFSDPVLNTFVNFPEAELARLIFHELAHQVVYVKDDTTFNESFAVAVEEAGVRRWLRSNPEADTRAYETLRARRAQFLALVQRYQERLGALYASGAPDHEKLAGKREAFGAMQEDYANLRASWGGWTGYDPWFARDLNNAHLASIATYTQFVPAFQRLLDAAGGDLPAFYAEVRRLASLPRPEREARLAAPAGGAAAAQ